MYISYGLGDELLLFKKKTKRTNFYTYFIYTWFKMTHTKEAVSSLDFSYCFVVNNI